MDRLSVIFPSRVRETSRLVGQSGSDGAVALIDQRQRWSRALARGLQSEVACELGERDPKTIMDWRVDGDLVVAAARVLHEGVTFRDGGGCREAFEAAHRL